MPFYDFIKFVRGANFHRHGDCGTVALLGNGGCALVEMYLSHVHIYCASRRSYHQHAVARMQFAGFDEKFSYAEP